MAFQLTKINQRKLDEVLKFAATHFSRHQVILRYLNITPELYAKIFNPLIEACYNSGFSYAAFNQSELASVMLALPYQQYSEIFKQISPSSISTKLSPVVALLDQVSNSYKPENGQKTLSHFIGCTNQKFRGNRFLSKLISQIEQEGGRQGFEQYVVGCTGKGPQDIFQSLKYQEKLRINYNKFTHEGKTPFVNLIDSDCVKLMTKKVQNIV